MINVYQDSSEDIESEEYRRKLLAFSNEDITAEQAEDAMKEADTNNKDGTSALGKTLHTISYGVLYA